MTGTAESLKRRLREGRNFRCLGQRERPPRLAVLVSPPWRTERHTATEGGTGRTAPGSPSRSTWSQRSSLASSVRTPTVRLISDRLVNG